MTPCSVSHLADHVLARDLAAAAANERVAISVVIEHLAEFDDRRLYLRTQYPSMHQYCVKQLGYSDDAAAKRIQAARAARAFPAIFVALADGRLHLTAVGLLSPHLSPGSVDELIAASAHKTKAQIELLLAERYPRPDLETRIQRVAQFSPPAMHAAGSVMDLSHEHAPAHVVNTCTSASDGGGVLELGPVAPATTVQNVPALPAPRARLTPLAPERFALQVTLGQSAHDKLRYAQALLGHAIAFGDVAGLLERALDVLIAQEEKRKFGAGARARKRTSKADGRYVPADLRRAVFQRDGGRCTFVTEHGEACKSRERLELDHVIPVARGGRTTLENLRLRCRAHNQYEAERMLGAGFMERKRRHDRARLPQERRPRALR